MFFYALYYFRKATTLRPYDSRMWCALANCYQNLDKKQEAIKCYIRADRHIDREGIALNKLALLHLELGDKPAAAKYYTQFVEKRHLEDEDRENPSQDEAKALLFLATFHKENEDYDKVHAEQIGHWVDHNGVCVCACVCVCVCVHVWILQKENEDYNKGEEMR